ncbi:DNA topoisomerase III [Paraferrimonas sp. SM1919]|uniref:DNA topoisomerase III n=1 Tax=Paraferrimonas sp. SM1919 TaxID=2662263 RepID=UPI0013D7D70B|nr:DNA topoisomerase III [Paraferrimonas sp. SM1919]
MLLYIAEKPSLGRAIATAIGGKQSKKEGYIELANGDCISWCVGHLLELAEPHVYDEALKSWRPDTLPIVPRQWQLKPKKQTSKQLTILKKLIKKATQLVHAGDPDREGQLLVDQVIHYAGVSGAKAQQTQRLLISDLTPAAVKKALTKQVPNRDFIPLSTSALARSRADWLYGINLTRAYTLSGRKVGYQGVLSVGRVQTPILGMVCRRDNEIKHFLSKPFYEVLAHNQTDTQQAFTLKWQPSEACQPYMDEEGRVLAMGLADNVVNRITGQTGTITELEQKLKKQKPPLLYSLSALQIDLSKRYGMSAQQVLDTCQALYERHQLLTYPRSDSKYLPNEQHKDAPGIINAIARANSEFQTYAQQADPKVKSKAFNSKHVDAHHAIVPTAKTPNLGGLSKAEQQVYLQVARQYLAQFYADYEFDETNVKANIAGGLFKAKAKVERALGFKVLFPRKNEPKGDEEPLAKLPPLVKGQTFQCVRGERIDKMTQPPKPYSDATLLSAMTGISRYVNDPQIKKILKETDGLGTEATRAGIIELLFKRGFLTRSGKTISATQVGQGLIASLPEVATTPDMTALWEQKLTGMSQQSYKYQDFMAELEGQLQQLVAQANQHIPTSLQGVKSAKPAFKKRRRRTTKKKA